MDKGAHFFKCDFQTHTPRDLNWKGARPTEPDARRAYASRFIAACRERGLDAIAVTDHHDVAFFPFIKQAAKEEKGPDGTQFPEHEQIVVFPGVELTLAIPCQAILLLDADFPESLLPQIPTILTVTPNSPDHEKHAETRRLDSLDSFKKLEAALDAHDFLKGRYTILPHVGKNSDFSLIRKGFANHYKSMSCVGGYVDGSIDQLRKETGTWNIVNGKGDDWGNKALGLFQTSDNRSEEFDVLGKHYTWVKWSTPTAEAIRQACLARHTRIFQDEPEFPQRYITEVQVSVSKFLGQVDQKLNPQYNAFIGGRGTGKSTLLEYIRWALCDQPVDFDDETDIPSYQKKRRDLVSGTLGALDATVYVSFLANGIEHKVRRSTKGNALQLKIGKEEFRECTEDEIRNLLPVQAYSQKQLSNVGVKVEELVRFVQLPIRKELESIDEKLSALTGELRTCYEDVQTKRSLDQEIEKYTLEDRSLNEQLKQLRGRLRGLSEEDKKTITEREYFDREAQILNAWAATLTSLSEVIAEFDRGVDKISFDEDIPDGLPHSEDLKRLKTQLDKELSEISVVSSDLNIKYSNIESGVDFLDVFKRNWENLKEENARKYESAKEKSSAHKATLDQVKQIEERLGELSKEVGEKKRVLKKLGAPVEAYKKKRADWFACLEEKATLMKGEGQTLTELSKGFIRSTLLRAGDTKGLQERFRATIKGAKVQNEKIEKLFGTLEGSESPFKELDKLLDELELLALLDLENASNKNLPHTPILDRSNFTDDQKRRICDKLWPANWIEIALTPAKDIPKFEYRSKEGEYIDFEDASAGQQATALMYVLLNQKGPPLLVDQPEDDLDSMVMNDVVEELWEAKKRRQLIFASHNANLVVNGDADLVIGFSYRNEGDQTMGRVSIEGAIDLPDVKNTIASVMEGGKEAFRLRQIKYGY